MSNNNMDMTNNEIFRLGVEIGRKQVMDHIQHQCSIGKPIEANGELYWLKDAKQNLMDIMDDIESTWNEDEGKIEMKKKSTRAIKVIGFQFVKMEESA